MRQRGAASRTVDRVDFGLKFGTPQSVQPRQLQEDGHARPSAAKRRRISGPRDADSGNGSTDAPLVPHLFPITYDREDTRRSATLPLVVPHNGFDKENEVPNGAEPAKKKTKRKKRKSVIPAALRKKKRFSAAEAAEHESAVEKAEDAVGNEDDDNSNTSTSPTRATRKRPRRAGFVSMAASPLVRTEPDEDSDNDEYNPDEYSPEPETPARRQRKQRRACA
ncbi:hypothetical protein DV736_g1895, partial [Chaetothyriales sp. CBS 134916]